MQRVMIHGFWGLLAAVVLGGAGCSSWSNPWAFDKPPARARLDPAYRQSSDRTVIVIGQFANPTKSPLAWRDIGSGVSEAVGRALVEQGEYDVLINPEVTDAVTSITNRVRGRRASNTLASLRRTHPEVDYVVIGKVTDFHHTADLPKEVQRWGLFGRRREAVVAVDFEIFDLRAQRMIGADHVRGTASASRRSTKELYADLAFDAYLFWSTPLGKASKKAVGGVVDRISQIVPPRIGEPKVIKLIARRKVSVTGGWMWGLAGGQRFYLCRRDDPDGRWRPIEDVDTGQPLMVRIAGTRRMTSTAWVMGEPPQETDLRGAVLRRALPLPVDLSDDHDEEVAAVVAARRAIPDR